MILSDEQIATFLCDGVLVVDHVLNAEQLQAAVSGLSEALERYGINTNDLENTGYHLTKLSSTGGSGGVLDIGYYDEWKITNIASNPTLFSITQQLWKVAYNNNTTATTAIDNNIDNTTNKKSNVTEEDNERWKLHPYGDFNCNNGYMYIDRIGYRLPSILAERLGEQMMMMESATENYLQQKDDNIGTDCTDSDEISAAAKKKKKKKKTFAIQRSLTPHLDCCPDTFHSLDNKTKWRPIQCFVSLSETTVQNHGGFEAVKGFHRHFDEWVKNRPPTIIRDNKSKKGRDQNDVVISIPAPCIGEYTHIRPKEDATVMQQIRHIPVKAGSAVFWDNRIPHANAYRHDGTLPRAVVYCSFLPDIPINQKYVQEQLTRWKRQQPPTDQWINLKNHTLYGNNDNKNNDQSYLLEQDNEDKKREEEIRNTLSPLGCRLAGLDLWELQ